jgi:multidrug efflux pump subunit AcrB
MGVGTLMGVGAALRMPIDIFPEIDIPVVAVVWTQRNERAGHPEPYIDAAYERQLASLVDDISRIEATSYEGVGVEKVYLHEGADVTRAVSQLASSALVSSSRSFTRASGAAGKIISRCRRSGGHNRLSLPRFAAC